MGKLTPGQKAERVLGLLLGMTRARIAAILATRGYTKADWEEGWRLLHASAYTKYEAVAPESTDPHIIVELDAWENTWFPVAKATLERRYPAVAAKVFLNLTQTEGPPVVLSVSTFINRITALSSATDQESKDAMALLEKRGINAQTLGQAQALLGSIALQEIPDNIVDLDTQRESIDRAETELWDWYLEWSQLARSVITDRAMLRALGFLKTRASAKGEDEEVDAEDEPSTPPAVSVSGYAPAMASQVSTKAS